MAKQDEGTGPAHQPGSRKGEEMKQGEGKESGRHESGETETGRPVGHSTARDSTSINPDAENPIDPQSPNMPPA
jgi:hypothetical protein